MIRTTELMPSAQGCVREVIGDESQQKGKAHDCHEEEVHIIATLAPLHHHHGHVHVGDAQYHNTLRKVRLSLTAASHTPLE